MKNLYLMTNATTVVDVGAVLTFKGSESGIQFATPVTDTLNTYRSFSFNDQQIECSLDFTFAKPVNAQTEIGALLASGAAASFCLGKDDGTDAPTAAASKFITAPPRTYIKFSGSVIGITERLTDTGPTVTVQIALDISDTETLNA